MGSVGGVDEQGDPALMADGGDGRDVAHDPVVGGRGDGDGPDLRVLVQSAADGFLAHVEGESQGMEGGGEREERSPGQQGGVIGGPVGVPGEEPKG